MEQELTSWGLPALFALSFLAATVAPVGSEWLLAVLLLQGSDPTVAVAVASTGNFLGACTTYFIGKCGRVWLEARGKFPQPRFYVKAENLFLRYGTGALLLTWLPLIGDALCLVAGVFNVGFMRFSAFTLTGKAARYALVALVIL
jgi:membrane protein YqaA with SNARE-associated domain